MTRSTPIAQRPSTCAAPPGGCRGRPSPAMKRASLLRVPDELGLPRKGHRTRRLRRWDIPAGAKPAEEGCSRQVVARRIAGSMLAKDRDGTSSRVVQVRERHPGRGGSIPRAAQRRTSRTARVELVATSRGPAPRRRTIAAQVDLSFRHAVIIRPPFQEVAELG